MYEFNKSLHASPKKQLICLPGIIRSVYLIMQMSTWKIHLQSLTKHVRINYLLKHNTVSIRDELLENMKRMISVSYKCSYTFAEEVKSKNVQLCDKYNLRLMHKRNIVHICLSKDGICLLGEGKCMLTCNFVFLSNEFYFFKGCLYIINNQFFEQLITERFCLYNNN